MIVQVWTHFAIFGLHATRIHRSKASLHFHDIKIDIIPKGFKAATITSTEYIHPPP